MPVLSQPEFHASNDYFELIRFPAFQYFEGNVSPTNFLAGNFPSCDIQYSGGGAVGDSVLFDTSNVTISPESKYALLKFDIIGRAGANVNDGGSLYSASSNAVIYLFNENFILDNRPYPFSIASAENKPAEMLTVPVPRQGIELKRTMFIVGSIGPPFLNYDLTEILSGYLNLYFTLSIIIPKKTLIFGSMK